MKTLGSHVTINREWLEPRTWSAAEIRSFREKLGFSQQELAEILGIGRSSVSHWEIAYTSPSGSSRRLLSLLEASAQDEFERLGR